MTGDIMYTKQELTAMDEVELNRVANKVFNLEVSTDTTPKKTIIDMILAAQPEPEETADEVIEDEPVEAEESVEDEPVEAEEVVVEVAPAPKPKAAPKAKAAPAPDKPKMFKIIVHNQEGVDASKFVKVQPNGTMYAIPREQEVVVPEIVVNVLKDAVVTRMEYENGALVERSARRHPFTILGEVK
jgi:hypothetical protein